MSPASYKQHSGEAAVPVPQLLTYADVPTAADTAIEAFADDPVVRYALETPDAHNTPADRAARRAEYVSFFTSLVKDGFGWTIDHGQSVVGYSPAKESNPDQSWTVTDVSGQLVLHALGYLQTSPSKEQQKRVQEIKDKTQKVVDATLGSGQDSMMYVNIAATAKAKQGRGYGSALIRVVNAKADEQARSLWLISSNSANTGFYNSVGFQTQGEIILGDDNPTWRKPPIIMALMVREYDAASDTRQER